MSELENGIIESSSVASECAPSLANGSGLDGSFSYVISADELGIVFECLGLALRQTFNQAQCDLNFVFRTTRFMERITPAVQSLASSRGSSPIVTQ